MKIYTSYFANLKNIEAAGIYPVAICCKVPKFFINPNMCSVAPTDSILFEYKNSQQTEEDWLHYKERYYNEVLVAYRFHPEYFIDRLEYFSGGGDVCLLCYEKPEDRCHRHLLAEWFNEKMPELNIEEYPVYPKKKEKKEEISIPHCDALF